MNSLKSGRLWLLVSTHTVNDFYTGAVAALLQFFVLERNYTLAAAAGLTLAATSLSSVAQPIFGHLTDRFGLRWMAVVGMLVSGTGIVLAGLAPAYWLTWVAIALSGLGVAAYHPSATVQAREAGRGSNAAMSVFSVGGNVGVALAPAGVLLTVGMHGLGSTPLLGIPAVVMAAVYLAIVARARTRSTNGLTVPAVRTSRRSATPTSSGADPSVPTELPREPLNAAKVVEPTSPTTVAKPADKQPFGSTPIVRDDWRAFGWLTAVLALWSIAYVGTSSFIALYSIQRFHVDEATASVALVMYSALGALGTLVGGWLADRYARLNVIRAGYLLGALAMLLIVAAPNPVVVVIGTSLLGLVLFVPFAPQITLSHSYLPNRLGMASGLTLGLSLSLGGFFSPILGAIADAISIQSTLLILAGLLGAGFFLSFVLRERPASAARPGEDTVAEAMDDFAG